MLVFAKHPHRRLSNFERVALTDFSQNVDEPAEFVRPANLFVWRQFTKGGELVSGDFVGTPLYISIHFVCGHDTPCESLR